MEQSRTGKSGKYFKYAISEIVLVVIGILIALGINNLNEKRKDRIKEQVILSQLKEDYQANLSQLQEKMAIRKLVVNSGLQVLAAIDEPAALNRDSVINNIAVLNNDPTFDPIKNDLISSGNLRLITNDSLKRILSNWTSDIVALKEIEVVWSYKVSSQFEPLMNKMGIGRDIANNWMNADHLWVLDDNTSITKSQIGTSKHKTSIKEIFNNKEFEGIVADAISYNTGANTQSEAIVKRINEILSLIASEIKEK